MENIVLVGFMGCGKSTVSKLLRDKTRFRLVDTDTIIEDRDGCAISRIFFEKGEGYFRGLEAKVLRELSGLEEALIVSTGGGIVTAESNLPLIKRLGRVVYLRVKPETVIKRLEGDTTRPLLMGEDKLAKVTTLMNAREAAYEAAADIVIEADYASAESIAEEILRVLR